MLVHPTTHPLILRIRTIQPQKKPADNSSYTYYLHLYYPLTLLPITLTILLLLIHLATICQGDSIDVDSTYTSSTMMEYTLRIRAIVLLHHPLLYCSYTSRLYLDHSDTSSTPRIRSATSSTYSLHSYTSSTMMEYTLVNTSYTSYCPSASSITVLPNWQ